MMSRDVMGRQMFANGGPAMPQPEMGMDQMAMMAQEQGVDPAQLQGALEMAQGQMQQIDNAENYEQVINGIRGDQQPLEARYAELTSVVGQEDSQATPESVLTLLQPVMQMAAVDQGIGGLAAEEMTAPIEGPMAEGIMSTVGMGEPDPVNFSQGGPVIHMAEGGVPNAKYAEEIQRQRDLYASVLGSEDREAALADQRRMTQAQMLFDIAQGGLALASPTERSMSFGERLATSFNPVFGNIGARAGELEKFKQGQAAEQRALDLQALGQAQNVIAAKDAQAHDLAMLNRRMEAEKALELEKYTKEQKLLYKGINLTYFSAKNLPNVFQNPRVYVPYALEDTEKTDIRIAQWEPAWENNLFQEAAPKTLLDANGSQVSVPGRRLTTDEINVLAIKNPDLLKDIRRFDEGITKIPTAEEAKKALQKRYGRPSAETSGETPIAEEYGGYRPRKEKPQILGPNEPEELNAARADESGDGLSEQYRSLVIRDPNNNVKVDLSHDKLQELPIDSVAREVPGIFVVASGLGKTVNIKNLAGKVKDRLGQVLGVGVEPAFPLDIYTGNVVRAERELEDVRNDMLFLMMEDAPGGRILRDLLDPYKKQVDKITTGSEDRVVAGVLETLIKNTLEPAVRNATKKISDYAGSTPELYSPEQIQDARKTLEYALPLLNRSLVIYEDFAASPNLKIPSFKDNRVGAISGIRKATNPEQEVTTSSGFGGLANRVKQNTVIK